MADKFNDTALGESPPRTGRSSVRIGSPLGKKAGGIPAKVRQSDGTENRRADNRTKSAGIPKAGNGRDRRPSDSYDDTKDF